MQVKKEYLDQALINWLRDNNAIKTKSFAIEGHKRLIILCTKLKKWAIAGVYYKEYGYGSARYMSVGDYFNEIIEEETKGYSLKFRNKYPVTLDEAVSTIQKVESLSKSDYRTLLNLKSQEPKAKLDELLELLNKKKEREKKNANQTLELVAEAEKEQNPQENKPQIVAGASNAVEKTVTVIDPIKEVKLKNLEQELELIGLKIRKCEILKEISALKNG